MSGHEMVTCRCGPDDKFIDCDQSPECIAAYLDHRIVFTHAAYVDKATS